LRRQEFIRIFVQTLTTLDLSGSHIGDEGAQHLAQALQNNTVRDVSFFSTKVSLISFITNTHHAQSLVEQYW
jgi:Ran GTPase-activating protein (RanGAP) involved in mRNA processing and transport